MGFETVSKAEEWLDSSPSTSEVETALEEEQDTENRVTAVRAFKEYLDNAKDDNGGDTVTVEFQVQHSFDSHDPGDVLAMDPDSTEAARLRRAGFVRR